jgi:hypothetical protein
VLHRDAGIDPQTRRLRDYMIVQVESEVLDLEPDDQTNPST